MPWLALTLEVAATTDNALAGILAAQADEVASAYAADFDARVAAAEDGWVLIEGRRR